MTSRPVPASLSVPTIEQPSPASSSARLDRSCKLGTTMKTHRDRTLSAVDSVHQQQQANKMEEEEMDRFSDNCNSTPVLPLTAVDALAEQLREKLGVSWTCVDLLDDNGAIMKSFADREGMPLFGIHGTTANRHQRRAFAFKTTLALVKDGAAKLTEVYDTWRDDRFADNVFVQSSPQRSYSVRFYAAMPIVQQCVDKGKTRHQVIGILGVCHHMPRRLTLDEKTLIDNYSVKIGHLLSAPVDSRSRGPARGPVSGSGGVKRNRKSSISRDDAEIVIRPNGHAIIPNESLKSPFSKRRSASCGPLPLVSIAARTKTETDVTSSRLTASAISSTTTATIIKSPSATRISLPDPKTSTVDPDEYLSQLVKALSPPEGTMRLQIKPSHEIVDFFVDVTEEQMARYNVNVVSMARNNDLAGIKSLFYAGGRDALDCYNRFGEGLLTLACRRGFRDMVSFFLSDEVRLPVRVRDDYGRTPVHDACWNPSPQLEICSWIMAQDPSLFLLADKRGFSAFQYARQSDWHIWRQFLFDHVDCLRAFVTQPDLVQLFTVPNK